ncbi:DNA alkylation repair enzyme (macronuclear) [Tetrahymena thermophila SB210]|uniref:DNA alkylation repair enzyme n=1 Tax=Tetrahymena thermophila (strain SB210) TaxID=312017 RepID=I7M3B0_TETTS|nr:DNA alkylation repair enzyme [Tetrahymena thermophila SB210]EAS02800.2 DNA alkylation repair enzyme [Tetrahymena thermophila SB210]|eukprot:XP_001023045.2 DNA alkylation repair enzyme [Tetrahymena thermophila SB210]
MSKALKDILFTKQNIALIGQQIHQSLPQFNQKEFLNKVFDDQWREKELKERMTHVSKTIQQVINKPYIEAINILLDVNERLSNNFVNMVFPEFVILYGIEYLDESMFALKQFTVNSSSEFAVRPFIQKYGQDAMQYMYRWSKDDNHHVRRLASEGCRPMLPWSFRLSEFVKDPTPILPILDQLKEDPELYVQKSVANNLNDISKNHPNLVLHICSDWKQINNQATQFIVKRACRTLLKKGNQQALDLFGVGNLESVKVTNLVIHDKNIRIGSQFSFSFDIEDTSSNANIKNENSKVKNKKIIIQSQDNLKQTKKMQSKQIKDSNQNESEDLSEENNNQDDEEYDGQDDSQSEVEEDQSSENILRIEYQIDYLKSNGTHSSKVFMFKNQFKLPQKRITLEGYQKVHQLTTRKHYPGIHHLSIIVNGTEKARTQFNLLKEK